MIRSYKAVTALLLALLLTVLVSSVMAAEQHNETTIATEDSANMQILCETGNQPPVFFANSDIYYSSPQAAAKELRKEMEARNSSVVLSFKTSQDPRVAFGYGAEVSFEDFLGAFAESLFDIALEHTGVPTQGDYLRWQYKNWECSSSLRSNGREYVLSISYQINYYTSAQQEAILDSAIKKLLDQLDVYNANDYEKVCAIYDYMCDNIVYDHAGLEAGDSSLIFTAYAALINKTSVCQGYSNLFYRLALELDIDSRIITGKGNGGDHAWNIVKLGGKYYALDATWDATYAQANLAYRFFLKCEADFGDHQPGKEYTADAFCQAYPMALKNYTYVPQDTVAGDFDGNPGITDSDAIYLLRFTLFPDQYPIAEDADADINCDGVISDADAIYLLRYTLFPDSFPLYPGK